MSAILSILDANPQKSEILTNAALAMVEVRRFDALVLVVLCPKEEEIGFKVMP